MGTKPSLHLSRPPETLPGELILSEVFATACNRTVENYRLIHGGVGEIDPELGR